MAWIAKMCRPPTFSSFLCKLSLLLLNFIKNKITKPLCYSTTKFTFKFYKIFSMFGTILNWKYITTICTLQLFRIEFSIFSSLLIFCHHLFTTFKTSKKRIFTFIALIIRVNSYCIPIYYIEFR